MCNIAGYSGNRQAAPILLEMIRRQQAFDGDMQTGIATIHEGKLYYRKIVGDVDELIRQTDALDLPGTIGIAHTRPFAGVERITRHPFLSTDETMALVTNGNTPPTKYCPIWDAAVNMLDEKGYVFRTEEANPENQSPKLSRNGNYIWPPEGRVFLIEDLLKQGKTPEEAMKIACEQFYSDNVTVMINQNYPDRIFALRTTRPMVTVMENGETYMATTRFALPEEVKDKATDLPLFHACTITKDGILISKEKMNMEPVSDPTPYTYHEAYRQIEEMLLSDKAPVFFDDVEIALDNDKDRLWPGCHTLVQSGRLAYDILWQFEQEGRLNKEIRTQELADGKRHRYYFWIDK